jgi:hypothetical protein
MGRKRKYSCSAERQKAYRDRARESAAPPGLPPARKPRKLSRPAIVAAAGRAVSLVIADYENWLDSLPESFGDTAQAQNLAETINSLSSAVDLMAGITPPRGFGRD